MERTRQLDKAHFGLSMMNNEFERIFFKMRARTVEKDLTT